MIRVTDGMIHTGYYSEEATYCFQLILRVVDPLYIKRTDLGMYNDRRIIRASDGELLLHYDIGLRLGTASLDVKDYYKTIFSRFKKGFSNEKSLLFKRDSSSFVFGAGDDNRDYNTCIQLCSAELKGERLKKLIGEPFRDQFKISALDILYSECLKTMEERGHDSATIERLMSQVREIFYS